MNQSPTKLQHAIAAATLAFSLFGSAIAAPVAADFTDGNLYSVGGFNNIGWSFSVTSSVTIDGLGIFDVDADGLNNRHQVGLWDSNGNLLAQTVVFNGATVVASAAASRGQWLFADIASLLLGPGDYVVGAFYSDGDTDAVLADAAGLAMDSHFSYSASLASDGASFDMPGAYGIVQPGVFGPNLRVAGNTVPEPGMLALAALALLAAGGARRRRS
ncbi:MAG TPA: PEP-CTERM sorting domain-containing protein [Roseateles sp.]